MKRYDELCENGYSSMHEYDDGEYVKYSDIEAILCALATISSMSVGELTMSVKLDPQLIGEIIYKATGMTEPELSAYRVAGALIPLKMPVDNAK